MRGRGRRAGSQGTATARWGGTGCVTGAVTQHPRTARWFCFLGTETPGEGGLAAKDKGSVGTLHPPQWGLPPGLGREPGDEPELWKWPEQRAEAAAAAGEGKRGGLNAHTHPPVCTYTHTRVHTPAGVTVHVWPREHPPGCFGC